MNPIKNKDLSFNQKCYELLKQIPKGRVTTYGAMAKALQSKAYQAVGNAMAHNPNPIVVPCHRVVNSDGKLGGYAFGKAKKIELLIDEGIDIVDDQILNFEQVFFDFSEIE